MHRNIARAYSCLQEEHDRIRVACVKILSQGDKGLERELLRALGIRDEIDHCFRGHADPDRSEATLAFVIVEK
jgi:hypothetical protein